MMEREIINMNSDIILYLGICGVVFLTGMWVHDTLFGYLQTIVQNQIESKKDIDVLNKNLKVILNAIEKE